MIAADGDLSVRLMRDEQADYDHMIRWLNDTRVLEWWDGRDNPLSPERAREKYSPRIAGNAPATSFFIELAGWPIGYIQFYRVADYPEWQEVIGLKPDPSVYSVDVFLGEPDLWGKGIGTQALRMVVRHLLEEVGAKEVVITPFAHNARAIRSYEKAGFRKERLIPKAELHEGKYQDEWLMTVG